MSKSTSETWLVAINPHSGNGRGAGIGERVTRYLDSQSVSYLPVAALSATQLSDALRKLTSENSYKGIIAVGGDGLAHLVLQICVPLHLPFAVVPAGTGNDFVRTLGWNLENIEPFLHRVITTEPTAIDLGNVDSEWFGAILSTGFDSVVNVVPSQVISYSIGVNRGSSMAIAML